MFDSPYEYDERLSINYDYGSDTQVSVISMTGIIVISTLLGLYLLSLFVVAICASFRPRWTNQFDAFTMMILGAAMAEKVPLKFGLQTDGIRVLDQMPGWIRDVADEHEVAGRLGLGAPIGINRKRRYECYEADRENFRMQQWK